MTLSQRSFEHEFSAVFLLIASLGACSGVAGAAGWSDQDLRTAAALRDEALHGTRAIDHVTALTTQVGARSAGSAGDRAAVAWALTYLRSIGFVEVTAQEVTVPHWERGSISVEITAPYPQHLVGTALGGSIGTPESGVEAPVLAVAGLAELEALDRDRVAGNIVFINARMQPSRDGSTYETAVRKRVDGASIASRLGAAALVIRSVGTSNDRIAHTGTMIYKEDVPKIPAIAISNPDADLLAREIASGEPVSLRFTLTARQLAPARSANVIAEVPGSDRAAEAVLLAAHLDSWDLGQGAEDDGAGVGIVVEAARRIAALPRHPSRTVRVVLFANEEYGLSGAREYAHQLGDGAADIVIAMEADFGSGAPWGLRAAVADEARPALATLRDVLKPLNLEWSDKPAEGGADLRPLRALGVPVFDVEHDGTRYFDVHHTVNDTLDRVDRQGLDRLVAAYSSLAYLAASMRGDFGRVVPPAEERGPLPAPGPAPAGNAAHPGEQ
jgi:carboxypeptidase Q